VQIENEQSVHQFIDDEAQQSVHRIFGRSWRRWA
jgi:hypothetical protein